jgi:hypothetical protein
MSYTPGPWVRGEIHDRHIVKDGNGNLVADAAGPSNLKQETREANARLIASAPSLLAALKQLMEWEGYDHEAGYYPDEDTEQRAIEVWDDAKAAITEAKGQKEVTA